MPHEPHIASKPGFADASAATGREPSVVPNMDLLRAVAVSAVMAYHFLTARYRVPGIGWAGVWLFFVLSGFLITRNLLASSQDRPFRDWIATFYWRRALRIFPLYFAYVLLASLLVAALASSSRAEDELPWLVTFTENVRNWRTDGTSAFYNHLWSLSAEEQFYVAFPLFIYAIPVKARNGILIAVFLAVSAVRGIGADMLVAAGYGGRQIENFSRVFPFMQWDAFIAGALLAVNEDLIAQARAAAIAIIAVIGLMAAAAIVEMRLVFIADVASLKDALLVHDVTHQSYQETWLFSLLIVFFACIVLCASRLRLPESWAIRVFNRLGRVSFGMYVFHMPICGPMLRVTHGWGKASFLLAFAVMYGLTIALAELSYRYWETPFLRLKGRVRQEPAAPVQQASISA